MGSWETCRARCTTCREILELVLGFAEFERELEETEQEFELRCPTHPETSEEVQCEPNLIPNKGSRQTILKKRQKTRYKPHTLTNKQITNLLLPQIKEHREQELESINGVANAQSINNYEQITVGEADDMYLKSRDLQNITTTTATSETTQRDIRIRMGMFKDEYKFSNMSNRTVKMAFIEYHAKDWTRYHITDLWDEDMQMKFTMRNTIGTMSAPVKSDIGQHPFAKGNRSVHIHFEHEKTRHLILEPGQTIEYTHVTHGRVINLNDINLPIVEQGNKPLFGPFTKHLMVICNGQVVEDDVSGDVGIGDYEIGGVRKRTLMYRAVLEQLKFQEYNNDAFSYGAITDGEGVAINPTNAEADEYEDVGMHT